MPAWLPGPWQLCAGESFSVFFLCVDRYQIMIFHIMILESIAALIEIHPLVRHNHDELVALRAIIHDAVLILRFWQRKYAQNAPVFKPDGSEPGEGRLHPDDPCSWIAVGTDELPIRVTDVLHHFLANHETHSELAIFQKPPRTNCFYWSLGLVECGGFWAVINWSWVNN